MWLLVAFVLVGARSAVAVVNGTEVQIINAPHAAAVISKNFQYLCGGAIIHENYVITAKHCVQAYPDWQVTVNSNFLFDGNSFNISVSNKILHPSLDVALLLLNGSINATTAPNSKNATLPTNATNDNDIKKGELVGWGVTNFTIGNSSEILKGTNLTILGNANCKTYFPDLNLQVGQICAYDKDSSPCDGDGGSVITYQGVAVGVLTEHPAGCAKNKPSIFVDVGSILGWIKTTIGLNSTLHRAF